MGLDESTHDVEAETRARVARPVPEAAEDLLAVGRGMPSPSSSTSTTTDRASHRARPAVERHGDLAGAVQQAVLDEVEEDLLEPVGVGPHLRQACSEPVAEAEPTVPVERPARSDDVRREQGLEVDGPEPQVEAVGVEPRDVEQLGDRRVRRLASASIVSIMRRFCSSVNGPSVEQAARETGDRCQRRPQLVRHGREDGRLVALGALAGLGVTQTEHDPLDRAARSDRT